MQTKLLLLLFLPLFSFAQNCVYVDSVYNTAKLRELGNRDIRFGVKQIVEDELSEKYCMLETGDPVKVNILFWYSKIHNSNCRSRKNKSSNPSWSSHLL